MRDNPPGGEVPAPAQKLPAFDDWKAPWEVDSEGNDIAEDEQQIDPATLKRLLYNLRKDKERLTERVTVVENERDEFKNQVEEKKREGESEVDRLKRENEELKGKTAEDPKAKLENVRLRAALKAGLPEEHIKRLDPDLTELDDIVEDAKKLMASFGGGAGTQTGEGDDEGDSPRGRPKQVRTAGDPKGGRRSNEVSIDDLLEAVPSSSSII